jgi:GNAT superfamily N-acetyltransferase
MVADLAVPDMLVTTYLEMNDPAEFRPAFVDDPRVQIEPMQKPDVTFYKFLYSEVGRVWRWRDRLVIPEEELQAAISRPGISIYVLVVDGEPAGYIELAKDGEDTEIAYFGLRPEYIGCGYGKHLLSYGIAKAWEGGAKRIWVHTCNLDGPNALGNYIKRGLRVYHVEEKPMPQRYSD